MDILHPFFSLNTKQCLQAHPTLNFAMCTAQFRIFPFSHYGISDFTVGLMINQFLYQQIEQYIFLKIYVLKKSYPAYTYKGGT